MANYCLFKPNQIAPLGKMSLNYVGGVGELEAKERIPMKVMTKVKAKKQKPNQSNSLESSKKEPKGRFQN